MYWISTTNSPPSSAGAPTSAGSWGGLIQVQASSGEYHLHYFLSTISFSLQLHFKQPWVRGKSLRGFSLAAMTALLMSCSPSWPMAKMLLLTSLLSILFNNNLLEVVREEEKGVQHAFNIKMGKYSDRCEAEGILFSWRLWESLSSRRCYIYTRWDNDQERILKTIFFTVKSILEWGSW